MTEPKYELPEHFPVSSADGVVYVSFEEAVANPSIGTRVIEEAFSDAERWFRQYAAFFERIAEHQGLRIVRAIEGVREELAGSWPGCASEEAEDDGLMIADEDPSS